MKDQDKTKEQLIDELAELRQRVAELETSEAERKRAEEALRDSRHMLQTVLDSIPSTVFWKDRDSIYLGGNRTWLEAVGLKSSEEVVGKSDYDLPWEEKQADSFRENDRRVMESGIPEYDIIEPYLRADGTHAWAKTNKVPLRDTEGNVIGVLGTYEDITERKRVEEALQESEERFRVALKGSPIVVWNQDKELWYTWIYNPHPGFKAEETIGKTDEQLLPPDDVARLTEIKRGVLESGVGAREEVRTTIGGEAFFYDLTVEPLRDLAGNIVGVTCASIDITEGKRAEEALRDSRRMLQTVLDSIPSTVFWKDRDSIYLGGNRAWLGVAGLKSSEEVVGKGDYDLPWGKKQADSFREDDRRVMESGIPEYDIIEPYLRADGTHAWAKTNKVPLRDTEGNVVGVLGTSEDITERKRAEEALRESEENFRALADNANDGIMIAIGGGTHAYANRRMAEITGCSVSELLKTNLVDLVHPDDLQKVMERFRKRLEGKPAPRQYEFAIVRKDGESVPIEITAAKTVWHGQPADIIVFRDITERRRAEEELRESEDRYRDLVEHSHDLICTHDLQGQILSANPAAEKLLGYDQSAMLKMNLRDILAPEVRDEFDTYLATIRRDGVASGVMLVQTSTGERRIWKFDNTLRTEGVAVPIVRGMARDITERKRAEESLRESERRLKEAQAMGRIGDWKFDIDNQKITWSDQVFKLYERDPGLGALTPEEEATYYSPEQARTLREYARRSMETGEEFEYDLEVKLPSGWTGYFSACMHPIKDESGRVVELFGTVQDVTERKLAEEQIRRHLERIEALLEIDRAIISTLDLTEVLDIILGELKRVIPYHSAGIYLLSDDTARLTAGRGFPDMDRVLQIAFPVKDDPLTREVLQEKRPLVLADAQADERFLARGGTEYARSWIGVPLIAKGGTVGFLTVDHREPGVYDEESAEMAQAFASQVAIAIENARLYEEAQRELAERERAEEELLQSYEKLLVALGGTIAVLTSVVEIRDPYTAGHQRRVAELACAIANDMGLSEEHIEGLRVAGLIHDLGKINVPAEILSKPSRLTAFEWGMIKMHPQIGYDILKTVEFPWPVAETVLQHHERLDGSGYPRGLTGKDILMKARILAVADVVEAMASFRPYRPALGIDKALEEISQNRGVLYDPEVVDACLRLFTEKGFTFE